MFQPITINLAQLVGDVTLSGVAQGQILYRGASKWQNLAVGTSGHVLTSGGAGADPSWAAASGAPFTDSTAVVKGSADATKLLRFEVDGFTTGTTRVLTPPDQDGTIALLERAQTFTQAQTIPTVYGSASSGGNLTLGSTSHATKGKITLPSGDATLSTPGAETILEQTGDSFGASRVKVRNRTGTAGVLVQNSGLDLVDVGFQPSVGGQWNLRLEHRSGSVFSGNTDGEFQFFESSSGTVVLQVGKAVVVYPSSTMIVNRTDAFGSAVTNILTLRHNANSGSPAAGMGTGIAFQIGSSATADQDAASIQALWSNATHATRKARLTFSAYDTAAREGLRIDASGSAALVGVGGAVDSNYLLTVNGDAKFPNGNSSKYLSAVSALGMI